MSAHHQQRSLLSRRENVDSAMLALLSRRAGSSAFLLPSLTDSLLPRLTPRSPFSPTGPKPGAWKAGRSVSQAPSGRENVSEAMFVLSLCNHNA